MPTTKITNRSLGINVARDNLGASSTMGTFLSSSTATDLRLAMGVSNTTGTGTLVFSTSPTITTPTIGQINTLTGTPLFIQSGAITSEGVLAIRQTSTSQNSIITFRDTTAATRGAVGFGNTSSATLSGTIYLMGGIGATGSGIPLVLGTNNTERMRILSDGNVGIGTSTPSERLTVSGNISASGTIIASNYDPAANVATFLATPTSANLAAAVTDETGTGALVFANSPTISDPTILNSLNGSSEMVDFLNDPSSANLAAVITDGQKILANSQTVTPYPVFFDDWVGMVTWSNSTFAGGGSVTDNSTAAPLVFGTTYMTTAATTGNWRVQYSRIAGNLRYGGTMRCCFAIPSLADCKIRVGGTWVGNMNGFFGLEYASNTNNGNFVLAYGTSTTLYDLSVAPSAGDFLSGTRYIIEIRRISDTLTYIKLLSASYNSTTWSTVFDDEVSHSSIVGGSPAPNCPTLYVEPLVNTAKSITADWFSVEYPISR